MIDIDATLVGSHSEKEHAAPTYKRGFGFHPLLAYLDATGEALAGVLRPGNAGSGTATDHIAVLNDALAQLPIDDSEVIVRTDSAGWSHRLPMPANQLAGRADSQKINSCAGPIGDDVQQARSGVVNENRSRSSCGRDASTGVETRSHPSRAPGDAADATTVPSAPTPPELPAAPL